MTFEWIKKRRPKPEDVSAKKAEAQDRSTKTLMKKLSSGIRLPQAGYMEGQLLIATPQLQGSCFEKAVIYVCLHNEGGAMGVVINNRMDNIQFSDLLSQLKLEVPASGLPSLPIHFGGPVDAVRGFILHSTDYSRGEELVRHEDIALSSSIDVLRDIAQGEGPKDRILVLGYAGWGRGQLEKEIAEGGWLTVPAKHDLIFAPDNGDKWLRAGAELGVDPSRISPIVGHA